MKRAITFSVGAVALAAMALPSAAADLGARPITKAPVAAPIAAYNWSGCYIGANAGGKWGRFRGTETIGPSAVVPVPGVVAFDGTGFGSDRFDSSFLAGGQVGCQWQSGAFVWGLEGDLDATRVRESFVVPGAPFVVPPGFLAGDTLQLRNRWQASVRGRIGYAWDRFMIYATGGVAFADVKATVGFVPFGPGFVFTDSQTMTGGTVGGGLEYGLTDNLSLGVEYRYTKFGHENFGGLTVVPGPFAVATPVNVNADLTTHEVTARLNWRFNWFGAGPVAGRY